MGIKRVILLAVGVCGSVFACWLLFLSGSNIYEMQSAIPVVAELEESAVRFPYAVPKTCLILREIMVYEGAYLEDNSNEYVVDVAAAVIVNTAGKGIENACVELKWAGGEYVFEVQMLPPGETVLVLDKNRQKYINRNWIACMGTQEYQAGEWSVDGGVVTEKDGLITAYNDTNENLQNICIYFKTYLPEEQMYLGGIAYCFNMDQLPTGEKVQIRPYRYISDYAKIVCVRAGNG